MATNPPANPHNFQIPNTPPSISSLAWGTSYDLLGCGSWNNSVCLYNVQRMGNSQPQIQPVTTYSHNAPVLSCCINGQAQLWSSSADGEIKVWQQGKEAQKIGEHSAGVQCTDFVDAKNIGVTAGWDKCIKYWDLRQQNPNILRVDLPERVYSMSISGQILCVALANRKIAFYNLNNPQTPMAVVDSLLKYQTRTVAMFLPGSDCFAVGSIEGRVSIQYIQEDIPAGKKNFAFKCHRDANNNPTNVYAINSLSVHPQFGTFSTAGGDGVFHFWDKDVKQRLQQFVRAHPTLPIVDTGFNKDGTMFAYACAYDWSKGYEYQTEDAGLYLHFPSEKEVKNK